ncbi:uncharacterized protein LOC113335128 isoform X2 [Papaver somniferum]|uniref:uncharacterized protein LOC113335128 isoform X2 n=1 Tax=Papaver somniferum TaxID=3469 RepID=UPI000E6FC3E2|nr:uncharacterized protein LOC113335128 isoform X2 [Papaver somniferum]
MSSAPSARPSLSSSHKIRRNQISNDHQNRTSSSSSNFVVGGLTHLPCRMRIMSSITTNKNVSFLSLSSATNSGSHYLFSRSLQPKKRTTHMELNATENLPAGTPVPTPPGPPQSGWFNWIIWTVIPMLFPFFKNKMSPLMLLKQKVETVVNIVDHAAEELENVAEEVVKITDEFEQKVPEGSVLKTALGSVHEVAEEAIKVAEEVEDLVDKGKVLEQKIEDAIEKQDASAAAEGQQQQKAEAVEKKVVDMAKKHDSVVTAVKEVKTDAKDFLKTTEAAAVAKQEQKNAASNRK